MISSLDERSQGPAADAIRSTGRWAPAVLWTVAAAAGFLVYLRLARTTPVNSDGSAMVLQAWDILHGNFRLSGWRTTDVSFYTTEVPEDLLILLVRGLSPGVVQVGAALTYTLVTLLGVALAKGTATGRSAVIRIAVAAGILLAPELVWGTHELISSPDHIGTTVPVLATWLILERAPRRRWVPVLTTALLTWSVIADQLVLAIAIVPLIIVSVVRHFRSADRWFEAWLAIGGIIAGVIGYVAPGVIHALGGPDTPKVISIIAPPSTIFGHNLPIIGQGLLILFGAYLPGLSSGPQVWFAALHVVSLVLVAAGIAVTARRFFREDLVPQLLLAGSAVIVAAYLVGVHAAVLENAREISSLVPFGAVLAARQLTPYLESRPSGRRIAVPVLGLVLAGYAAGLATELTVPAAPPENAQLTAWLARHPLGGAGLSGYWQSNVVTLTSRQRVLIRPVSTVGGQISPRLTETKKEWWDARRSYSDFVVLTSHRGDYGYPGFTGGAAAFKSFGPPARVYHVGPYTIWQWHKNLLSTMDQHMPANDRQLLAGM